MTVGPGMRVGICPVWGVLAPSIMREARAVQQGPDARRAGTGTPAPARKGWRRAYNRVTVYCPQAVKAIVTVVVVPCLVTMAISVPVSNLGRSEHDAL